MKSFYDWFRLLLEVKTVIKFFIIEGHTDRKSLVRRSLNVSIDTTHKQKQLENSHSLLVSHLYKKQTLTLTSIFK